MAAKEGYYAAIRNIPVDSWPSLPKPFLEKALTDLRSFAKVRAGDGRASAQVELLPRDP